MKKLLYGLLVTVLVVAQEAFCAVSTTDKAMDLYKAGKYDSTIIVIRNYLRKHGKDQESEALVPLISEALVRKGDYTSVHRLATMYRQKFDNSPFQPRLWYLEGVSYGREEKYLQSITCFSSALDGVVSAELDSLVMSNVRMICEHITAEEFTEVSSKPLNPRILEIVQYYEISKLLSMKQFAKAQNYAVQFKKNFPRSRYEFIVRDIVASAREKQKGILQIGILAPISGDEAEIGKKVVQGAQIAIDLFTKQNGLTIENVVLDTRGNMVATAHRTMELIDDHQVPVIIGPVLSQTATVCAALSIGKPVVMISPTATDDGIAGLGKNIFQMNVTLGVLGSKVARYAVENLNIQEFAIMAPQTSYGILMAESFKEELKKKSMELVAEEYFEEGGNDFSAQFRSLRSKLLLRHLEKIAMNKGLDFNGRLSRRDSLRYADSTLSIGGLFIPADAEDVVMIAPQVSFNRIRTQILGSNGWHNQKVIKDGKQYVVNSIISTSFELDQNQKDWLQFKKAYKERYNGEPDRISALGYDAAQVVMKAIKDVGDDPARISEALFRCKSHSGLSGMISFENEFGANSEAVILKITQGGFVRVQ